MGADKRRSARINARIWTHLEGVDNEWKLRRCNLSVSGIFIEIEREVGEPGSVQRISLRTQSSEQTVTTMARIIRILASSDLWNGKRISGVAFEFMPDSAQVREQIEALTRHYLVSGKPDLTQGVAQQGAQLNYDAQSQPGTAMLKSLSVSGMVLQTSWEAQAGEVIRCEITAPGSQRTFRLEGEVVQAVADEEQDGSMAYQVQVQFYDPTGRVSPQSRRQAEGLSINDAIDALLEEAMFAPREANFTIPNEHLGGLLSRIRLPSLLGFMEIERLTGVLTLMQGADVVQLYLRQGALVDVESPEKPGADPIKVLQPCMNWAEGKFEFVLQDVSRAPRINMSTTHLLLKLTTEAEEQNR